MPMTNFKSLLKKVWKRLAKDKRKCIAVLSDLAYQAMDLLQSTIVKVSRPLNSCLKNGVL
jgi:hypothetical protein